MREKTIKCPECLADSTVNDWNRKKALETLTADWNDSIQSIDEPGAHGTWSCPKCNYPYSK